MKQISIFLQNTNGQLAELVELFSARNINLRAMSLADTQDYGDPGSTPGWGRSPGEGNGHPLQYSYLESSRDRGAW